MKSQTFTVPPILGCLQAAEKYLLENNLSSQVQWEPCNEEQIRFVKEFVPLMKDLPLLDNVLKSIADMNPAVINQWLKENGFNIRLPEQISPDAFSVASILKVIIEWMKVGTKSTVRYQNQNYSAVKMKQEDGVVVLGYSFNNPTVCLKTKSDEHVFITMTDKQPKNSTEVAELISNQPDDLKPNFCYDEVTFPMVKYDQEIDLSWICGLRTESWHISHALQQTKFEMDEVGAKVESAMAMTMFRSLVSSSNRKLFIDEPFLLWITRHGCSIPIFGGYFAEDSWIKSE